jgi:large subunit ribosomal protein L24
MEEALHAVGTTTTVLRSLRHLERPTKHAKFFQAGKPSQAGGSKRFVQPRDRVPFWNIVPGDIVKLNTGNVARQFGLDPNEKVRGEGRVISVDREKNTVLLANLNEEHPLVPHNTAHNTPRLLDPNKPERGFGPTTYTVPRPIHYSNLTLKIPDLEDTYALRIIKKNLHFHKASKMWRWQRYAVIRNRDGINEKIEVPWPKTRKTAPPPKPDASGRRDVEEETWLPWAPSDPIHLLPKPPRNSAHSVSDVVERLAALEVARVAKEQESADLYKGTSQGRYPGFQTKKLFTPPPVPQEPSAAEVLALAKKSMSLWASSQQDHASQGGRSFAASDYLSLAPQVGPVAGGSWQLPIADALVGTESFERDPHTGTLLSVQQQQGLTSKVHLDSMPVELLMKEELSNERGRKWRQQRWQARLVRKAKLAKNMGRREQRNKMALREYLAEKAKVGRPEGLVGGAAQGLGQAIGGAGVTTTSSGAGSAAPMSTSPST